MTVKQTIEKSYMSAVQWCKELNAETNIECRRWFQNFVLSYPMDDYPFYVLQHLKKAGIWTDVKSTVEKQLEPAKIWCNQNISSQYKSLCQPIMVCLLATNESDNSILNSLITRDWPTINELLISSLENAKLWSSKFKSDTSKGKSTDLDYECIVNLRNLNLSKQIEPNVMDLLLQKNLTCDDAVFYINGCKEKAKKWCKNIPIENECILKFQQYFMTGILNDDLLKQLYKNLDLNYYKVFHKIQEDLNSTRDLCIYLDAGNDVQCNVTLTQYALKGFLDKEMIHMAKLMKNFYKTWNLLIDEMKTNESTADKICTEFSLKNEEKHNCKIEYYNLLMKKQIDWETFQYKKKTEFNWKEIITSSKRSYSAAVRSCSHISMRVPQYNCFVTIHWFFMNNILNEDKLRELKNYFLNDWDKLAEWFKTSEDVAKENCHIIENGQNKECTKLLRKYLIEGAVESNLLALMVEKLGPLRNIKAAIENSYDIVRKWCIERFHSVNKLTCTALLQQLHIEGMLDDELINIMKKSNYTPSEIREVINKTLKIVNAWCLSYRFSFQEEQISCSNELLKFYLTGKIRSELIRKIIKETSSWAAAKKEINNVIELSNKWCKKLLEDDKKCNQTLHKLFFYKKIDSETIEKLVNNHKCNTSKKLEIFTESVYTNLSELCKSLQAPSVELIECTNSFYTKQLQGEIDEDLIGELKKIYVFQKFPLIHTTGLFSFTDFNFGEETKSWKYVLNFAVKTQNNSKSWCKSVGRPNDYDLFKIIRSHLVIGEIDDKILKLLKIKCENRPDVAPAIIVEENLHKGKGLCRKCKAENDMECIKYFTKSLLDGVIDDKNILMVLKNNVDKPWEKVKDYISYFLEKSTEYCNSFKSNEKSIDQCIKKLTNLYLEDLGEIIDERKNKFYYWTDLVEDITSFFSTNKAEKWSEELGIGGHTTCVKEFQTLLEQNKINEEIFQMLKNKYFNEGWIKVKNEAKNLYDKGNNWCDYFNAKDDKECVVLFEKCILMDYTSDEDKSLLKQLHSSWKDFKRQINIAVGLANSWCDKFNEHSSTFVPETSLNPDEEFIDLDYDGENDYCKISLLKLYIKKQLDEESFNSLFRQYRATDHYAVTNIVNTSLSTASIWCDELQAKDDRNCIFQINKLILLDLINNDIKDQLKKKYTKWSDAEESLFKDLAEIQSWCNLPNERCQCIKTFYRLLLENEIEKSMMSKYVGIESFSEKYTIINSEISKATNWCRKLIADQVEASKEFLTCRQTIQKLLFKEILDSDGQLIQTLFDQKISYDEAMKKINESLAQVKNWCKNIRSEILEAKLDDSSDQNNINSSDDRQCIKGLFKYSFLEDISENVMTILIQKYNGSSWNEVEDEFLTSYSLSKHWCRNLKIYEDKKCLETMQIMKINNVVDLQKLEKITVCRGIHSLPVSQVESFTKSDWDLDLINSILCNLPPKDNTLLERILKAASGEFWKKVVYTLDNSISEPEFYVHTYFDKIVERIEKNPENVNYITKYMNYYWDEHQYRFHISLLLTLLQHNESRTEKLSDVTFRLYCKYITLAKMTQESENEFKKLLDVLTSEKASDVMILQYIHYANQITTHVSSSSATTQWNLTTTIKFLKKCYQDNKDYKSIVENEQRMDTEVQNEAYCISTEVWIIYNMIKKFNYSPVDTEEFYNEFMRKKLQSGRAIKFLHSFFMIAHQQKKCWRSHEIFYLLNIAAANINSTNLKNNSLTFEPADKNAPYACDNLKIFFQYCQTHESEMDSLSIILNDRNEEEHKKILEIVNFFLKLGINDIGQKLVALDLNKVNLQSFIDLYNEPVINKQQMLMTVTRYLTYKSGDSKKSCNIFTIKLLIDEEFNSLSAPDYEKLLDSICITEFEDKFRDGYQTMILQKAREDIKNRKSITEITDNIHQIIQKLKVPDSIQSNITPTKNAAPQPIYNYTFGRCFTDALGDVSYHVQGFFF